MANIKSQIKRNKQNEAAHLRNKSVKSALKTAVRSFREAVKDGDTEKAQTLAKEAARKLDKAASAGVTDMFGGVVADDLGPGQAIAAAEQVIAVAGQEIVLLAKDDLQAVAGKVEIADDLGVEQGDGVGGGAVAEARQELVRDRSAADVRLRFQDQDLEPLLREIVAADEAVVARANDDCVVGQCRSLTPAPH